MVSPLALYLAGTGSLKSPRQLFELVEAWEGTTQLKYGIILPSQGDHGLSLPCWGLLATARELFSLYQIFKTQGDI